MHFFLYKSIAHDRECKLNQAINKEVKRLDKSLTQFEAFI